eukprot:GHRQ01033194.1.p1 GENE.GHRQ01033194.1~~GHRQ01033194.1.p1  ORF type:complete len:178 (+),score=22.04 GHRQ01033194.1:795-1328(+)
MPSRPHCCRLALHHAACHTCSAHPRCTALPQAGNLILCEPSMAAREATAAKVAAETGATFIPPYDYGPVIAGQGTIGLELLQQVHTQHAGPILRHLRRWCWSPVQCALTAAPASCAALLRLHLELLCLLVEPGRHRDLHLLHSVCSRSSGRTNPFHFITADDAAHTCCCVFCCLPGA